MAALVSEVPHWSRRPGRVATFLDMHGVDGTLLSMADPEIEAVVRGLIAGGESYNVEFKTAWNYGPDGKAPRDIKEVAKDIGEALVAFANTDGGDLLIGVEDSREVTGVPWEGDKLRYLEQSARLQIKDADLNASVFDVALNGKRVLLFRVSDYPSEVVVTVTGRCLWRRGNPARSEAVPPADIARRRSHRLGDTAYESAPVPEATLEDISIPSRILESRLHLKNMDLPTLLRYWNLVQGRNGSTVLLRAALLLFAKDPLRWHPNNRVRIIRSTGVQPGYGRGLATRQFEVLGPIERSLGESRQALYGQLEVESRASELFTVAQSLPREAVDECIVNALAHRNYAIEGSSIEIHLFPERVEFRSPGKLPEPLTIKDLQRRQGAHRSRNPIIMRVLRDLGWTRDQGEGMQRIFGSMAQVELNDPELEERADTFIVRLSTVSRYDAHMQAWLAAYGPFGLQPHERKYVVALQQAGGSRSVDKLARQLGETFDKTRDALMTLEAKRLVWHRPHGRSYTLVEPLDVPHERAYNWFDSAHVSIDGSAVMTKALLRAALNIADDQSLVSAIARLRESGILVAAGPSQWRFGQSLLEYIVRRRSRPSRHTGPRSS